MLIAQSVEACSTCRSFGVILIPGTGREQPCDVCDGRGIASIEYTYAECQECMTSGRCARCGCLGRLAELRVAAQ